MPAVPFETSSTAVELTSSPIVPAWIVEGQPVARAAEVARSADGTSFTVIWDCTAGSFVWTYHFDETIHILEGSIVLTDGGNPPTRLGPGDIVFFPKGSQVHWQVDDYVKKVAFFRKVVPNPFAGVYNLLRTVKRSLRPARSSASSATALDGLRQSA